MTLMMAVIRRVEVVVHSSLLWTFYFWQCVLFISDYKVCGNDESSVSSCAPEADIMMLW